MDQPGYQELSEKIFVDEINKEVSCYAHFGIK